MKLKSSEIGEAVDAIILDDKQNIVLIKRKYPPFRDFYALPGGLVTKGEKTTQALLRETKEETNLDVQIIKKIGYYDEKGRDPRGEIHSTAFKCKVISDISKMKSGDDSRDVELVPIEKLKKITLAFDHRKMLEDAEIFK